MTYLSVRAQKPVLHFAPANGFVWQAYAPILQALSAHFVIESTVLGQDKRFGIDDDWQSMTHELLCRIDDMCTHHQVDKIYLLGHSMGAMCSFKALYHTDKVARALLLDPPVIFGTHSLLWRLVRPTRVLSYALIDALSPAHLSKYRRVRWQSYAAARQSLAKKDFFASFDPRCFDAYIRHGLAKDENGVRLVIDSADEVAVFRTNPAHFWRTPIAPPTTPFVVMGGSDSPMVRRGALQGFAKHFGVPLEIVKGGHMFPLQYPDDAAKRTLAYLSLAYLS